MSEAKEQRLKRQFVVPDLLGALAKYARATN